MISLEEIIGFFHLFWEKKVIWEISDLLTFNQGVGGKKASKQASKQAPCTKANFAGLLRRFRSLNLELLNKQLETNSQANTKQ